MLKTIILSALITGLGVSALAESPAATDAQSDAETADQAIDLAAAEAIYQKSCRACHGRDAQGAASYPGLADLDPDYIVQMLGRYRAGERVGPNSILMIQHATKLSDKDIASLAVYVTTAFDGS